MVGRKDNKMPSYLNIPTLIFHPGRIILPPPPPGPSRGKTFVEPLGTIR